MTTVAQGLKMPIKNKYAVFILSNGRPDNVITYRKLRSSGYTGDIYIICDDEDETLSEYQKIYKDEVIVFSKKSYENKFDIMDNFKGNKVIVYARNACYDIARKLGIDYFFEYEDDYTAFSHRYVEDGSLKTKPVQDMDGVLDAFCRALHSTGSDTIAFAQGGELMGGANYLVYVNYKRKAMNSFVFKVNKDPKDDINFIGRMNDDVNTYLTQGSVGKLFFQTTDVSLVQKITQSNSGGNTDAYKESGTYVKSFYSIMAAPSCCKVSVMGTVNKRLHHQIKWKNAVPKIIKEVFKKK